MVTEPRMKKIYHEIQKKLFYMIPEKWDSIYLYASIIQRMNHLETGEMFFYYFPKGILKKNPINVYEIPSRFSIDDDSYLKIADELYGKIKELRNLSIEIGEEPWSNLTISIENFKFKVEYSYENLVNSNFSSYERHLIWRYKYLQIPIESYSKKDKEVIERYLYQTRNAPKESKMIYEEPIYKKPVKNIIDYDKEKYEPINYAKGRVRESDEEIEENKGRSQILKFN